MRKKKKKMSLPVLPEAFYSELYLVADAANLCWLGQAVKGSTGSQKVHRSRDLKRLETSLYGSCLLLY